MRLIHLLLASLLASGLAAQSVNYRDTLEVEIGQGAKVIFLAQNAEDFEAIDRYDLNYIFEELWRRRQAGEQGLADLSREDLEQLQEGKPRLGEELPTPISTKTSKRRFYVNLNTGFTFGGKFTAGSDPFFFADNPSTEISYVMQGKFQPSIDYEMSLGTDYSLRKRNGKELVLKLALGWSSADFRLKDNRFGYFFAYSDDGGLLSLPELNAISEGRVSTSVDRKFTMSTFFFEAVPNIDLFLDKQKRSVRLGVGPRIGFGTRNSGTEKLGDKLPIFDWDGTTINVVQPKVQYAAVSQLSYRTLQLYGNYYPRTFYTSTSTANNTINTDSFTKRKRYQDMWTVGLKTRL